MRNLTLANQLTILRILIVPLFVILVVYGMLGAAWGVGIADFDRDGDLDVVSPAAISNNDGPFIFYGNPDGTLQDGIQIENYGNNFPTDVAVGDFNDDGWLDFVTGNQNALAVAIFLNDGFGNYLAPTTIPVGGNIHGVALLDCDSDGDESSAGAWHA